MPKLCSFKENKPRRLSIYCKRVCQVELIHGMVLSCHAWSQYSLHDSPLIVHMSSPDIGKKTGAQWAPEKNIE